MVDQTSLSRSQIKSANWKKKKKLELEEVEAELGEIANLLKTLNVRQTKLKHKKRMLQADVRYGRTFEPRGSEREYIDSKSLLIYIERWKADNNSTNSDLAEIASVSPRTIERVTRGEGRLTTFVTADRLLSAMGVPQVINTMTTVHRNGKTFIPDPPESQFYEE